MPAAPSARWPAYTALPGGAPVSPDDNKAILRTYVETIFNQK
jgi:hypothetical protein